MKRQILSAFAMKKRDFDSALAILKKQIETGLFNKY